MGKNRVIVESDQCKGCRLCIESCPKKCLELSDEINSLGYQPAKFIGSEKCVGCGLCFYVCPEPGAITVIKGE